MGTVSGSRGVRQIGVQPARTPRKERVRAKDSNPEATAITEQPALKIDLNDLFADTYPSLATTEPEEHWPAAEEAALPPHAMFREISAATPSPDPNIEVSVEPLHAAHVVPARAPLAEITHHTDAPQTPILPEDNISHKPQLLENVPPKKLGMLARTRQKRIAASGESKSVASAKMCLSKSVLAAAQTVEKNIPLKTK